MGLMGNLGYLRDFEYLGGLEDLRYVEDIAVPGDMGNLRGL